MNLSLDDIAALIAGSLPAHRAAAVREALAASPEARSIFQRLTVVAETIRADRGDPVPTTAIAAAKDLGSRLDRFRPASILDRVDAFVDSVRAAITARLVFDSRAEGAIAGLRGGSGFAVAYAADGLDIDIEVSAAPDGTFDVLGQIATQAPDDAGMWRGGSVIARDATDPSTRVASATIDDDGMFRFRLASGGHRFLLRFQSNNPTRTSVELDAFDVP